MNNKQTRDWMKMHAIKKQRALSKEKELSVLTQHHNELLARFYGNPTFTSKVANKVNEELTNQLIRHIV